MAVLINDGVGGHGVINKVHHEKLKTAINKQDNTIVVVSCIRSKKRYT